MPCQTYFGHITPLFVDIIELFYVLLKSVSSKIRFKRLNLRNESNLWTITGSLKNIKTIGKICVNPRLKKYF
jgi:hypothetical protein